MPDDFEKHCGIEELDRQHDQIDNLIGSIGEDPTVTQLLQLFHGLIHHFLFEERLLRVIIEEEVTTPRESITRYINTGSIQAHAYYHHCILTQLVLLIEAQREKGDYQDFISRLDRNDNLDHRYFHELSENSALLERIRARAAKILDETPSFSTDIPLANICDMHQGINSLSL